MGDSLKDLAKLLGITNPEDVERLESIERQTSGEKKGKKEDD